MFRLTADEATVLRSQFATSKTPPKMAAAARDTSRLRSPSTAPSMAANVLNSPRAVEMGVYVVRAFVRLRELLASNQELAKRIDQLEARLGKKLASHDEAIAAILSAIRELMSPPTPSAAASGSPPISATRSKCASVAVCVTTLSRWLSCLASDLAPSILQAIRKPKHARRTYC